MSSILLKLVGVFAAMATLISVQANYEDVVNYADSITMDYACGYWQCDILKCPYGTYGCKIVHENSPTDPNIVIRKNICFQEDGSEISVLTKECPIANGQNVKVNVTSYVDAETNYGTSYSPERQGVHGTVCPTGWPHVREDLDNVILQFYELTKQ